MALTTDGPLDPNPGYSPTTGISVKLSDVPSPGDFTNLFDQYRVKNASVTLIYRGGNVLTQGEAEGSTLCSYLPTFFYINDHDDNTSIDVDTLLEHQRMRMKQMTNNKTMTRYSIPTYTVESVSDGTDFGNVPRKSPWIDTANDDVNHGNLKLLVQGTQAATYHFDVIYKLTIQGKNPR